jgi:uncharacterized delta-60 repeat protein
MPYVIRYLPNGDLDNTFGNGGEIDTDFGLPRPVAGWEERRLGSGVSATSITVDSADRPIVAGHFPGDETAACNSAAPYVARLTAIGSTDTTFAGTGYALPGGHGEVTALSMAAGGGPATLSRGFYCGPHTSEEPSRLNVFTENGEASPSLEPNRPAFDMTQAMAIDPVGRFLVTQTRWEQVVLVRLLPNGVVDAGFGQDGGVAFNSGWSDLRVFAVDARGRPILGGGSDGRIQLRRLRLNGRIDARFGNHGRLTAKGESPEAVALDARGRIYTVSQVSSPKLKTGHGIEVVRFLPSR